MTTYVSGGYRRATGGKKLAVFYEYKDGEICEDNLLKFAVKKATNKPVGWVIEIEEADDSFSGFEFTGEILDDERINEYRLEHTMAIKAIELENLRKKSANIRGMLEGMTLGEIREWVDKSRSNKRIFKFYLMELF